MKFWLIFLLFLQLPTTHCFAHGPAHEHIARLNVELLVSPAEGELYLKRALCEALDGNLPRARTDWETASCLFAGRDGIGMLDARLCIAEGQYAEAVTALDPILQRHAAFGDAWYLRGLAHAGNRKFAEAAADFGSAIDCSFRPQPDFFLQRSAALCRLDPPRRDEALNCLKLGLQRISPPDRALQLAALTLETELGHYDAALARILVLSESSNRKEIWFTRAGELLSQAGRRQDAVSFFLRAHDELSRLPEKTRNSATSQRLRSRITAGLSSGAPPTPVSGAPLPPVPVPDAGEAPAPDSNTAPQPPQPASPQPPSPAAPGTPAIPCPTAVPEAQ